MYNRQMAKEDGEDGGEGERELKRVSESFMNSVPIKPSVMMSR